MASKIAASGIALPCRGADMTFSVLVGAGGYLGWKNLQRTQEVQRDTLASSSEIRRARDYFVANASNLTNADGLVSDYRLLNVALTAFGLEADMGNRKFIRRIIEGDVSDRGSLVNKMTDKRYLALNQAFSRVVSSDAEVKKSGLEDFINFFHQRSFERSLGKSHPELEIALYAQRELSEICGKESSENAKWYSIIASKPLRKLFEGAFGLNGQFGSLPVDRQVQEIKGRLQRLTGRSDASQFTERRFVDKVIDHFLLRSDVVAARTNTRFSIALEVLRRGGVGAQRSE